MATLADLDELALSLPQATKELTSDGRPEYYVHGKLFCCHRGRRKDAVDAETGERLDDVLMFRVPDLDVKELLLADTRGVFFTTPHFDGYARFWCASRSWRDSTPTSCATSSKKRG
jgi:hypothetical protein